MIRDLQPLLAQHPFFSGMREEHLALLAGCATNRRYAPGEFLLRMGDPANHFFIIRHGRAAIELSSPDRGPLIIQTIGEGDVLGWSWIVPPYISRFDARAMEMTRAIALDGACLRGKFDADHELAYEMLQRFIRVLAERLESSRIRLLDLYGRTEVRV